MKQTILLLLAAIGLFILPTSKLLAQAQVVSDVIVEDAYYSILMCDGNQVDLQATETITYHTVINKNKASITGHSTVDGTSTDAAGNTYKLMQSANFKEQTTLVDGGFSFTINSTLRIISQGSASNYIAHSQSVITIAPDGTRTVTRYRSTFPSCD